MSSLDSTEAQWKDVFNIYDTDKDGKISKADFISAVRVLGRRYTKTQMDDKMKAFGDPIHWDHFYGFMCDPYTGPTPDDLTNALKAFDGKDSGELTVAQLSSLLTTMGDRMKHEDVAALLENMQQSQGRATIADIREHFTPPVPSTTPDIAALMKEVMREEVRKANMAAELQRAPEAQQVESVGTSSNGDDAPPPPEEN
jgi:Ca2+-binding EF-hand superfamily protein